MEKVINKRIDNKAYKYCKQAIQSDTTPRYVKLQMNDFMSICEDKNPKYKLSVKKLTMIEGLLKILIMPKGLKVGQSLYECTTSYQWLVYTASLCVVYRDNPGKRRYETVLLEICRKNFKTYTIATLMIILMLTEPQFSQFYSVAPDGSLSREVMEAIKTTLKASPLIYKHKNTQRFKILRDYIQCEVTETKYVPLNYSTSTLDGKLPNVFLCDETGALPSVYPLEAMRSGQLNILNKLGFVISTKYPTINNPFEQEVAYSKKVLDGTVEDEKVFSLLYEPDNIKDWETNDLILKQANPVSLEIPEIWEDLLQKRSKAIAQENVRENFVTKHCNIIYSGSGTETFIDVSAVQACKVESIDWNGRVVYLGLDLSETNDNTSVTMLSVDEDNRILADSYCFIPEDRIEEKQATERVDYRELIKSGKVIACGNKIIDYKTVEDFILSLESRLGVQIQAIGFDRWNALSTAQKLKDKGLNTIEIRQHSSVLHPPTKLLKEKILQGDFMYTENPMYEINFLNSKCTYDTNKNLYVNKKKSNGKIDMVVSTINACYLLQQDYFMGTDNGFTIQIL